MQIPGTDPGNIRIDTVNVEIRQKIYGLSVLRLDLIHSLSGGNKWFKLKENIKKFYQGNYSGILSFGGAYSNHIAALADVCHALKIPVTGVIRGEEVPGLNTTLSRARAAGMHLKFVSRDAYRRYRNPEAWPSLYHEFGNVLIIPEGGSNVEGIEGCREIAKYIPDHFSHVALAVGTGATLCGLASGLYGRAKLIGIKVVDARQEELIFSPSGHQGWKGNNIVFSNEFVFGGYAKKNHALDIFVNNWNSNNSVLIEPVYTGRLFYGIKTMLEAGYFASSNDILLIHTGGRQYLDH